MINTKIIQEYDFDDVVVLPTYSATNSRNDIDISVKLSDDITLDFPFIASPMRGIVDANFGVRLAELGGMAILHRFYDSKIEHLEEIKNISNAKLFGLALGLTDTIDEYKSILEYQPNIITIDVANGYTKNLLDRCYEVRLLLDKYSPKTRLMSGNVATLEGVINLANAGVHIVRVGIGNGAECSTTNVTGIGRPIISALMECSNRSEYSLYSDKKILICADGGIKNSGDFVKAIVAGADVCMGGALFAQTYESTNDGIIYGQASKKLQEMRGTQIKSIEGFERIVTKTQSLANFINDFSYGIRSAGTYLDAHNLSDIRKHGRFVIAGRNTIKKEY